jgi:hypothetical protein
MTVRLNRRAYEHAKRLINKDKFVFDDKDAWSEHQPSARQENEFIRQNGLAEYARWYLGINDEKGEQTKGHYEFPFGDSKMSTVAGCSARKVGPANTSTMTSKTPRLICTG